MAGIGIAIQVERIIAPLSGVERVSEIYPDRLVVRPLLLQTEAGVGTGATASARTIIIKEVRVGGSIRPEHIDVDLNRAEGIVVAREVVRAVDVAAERKEQIVGDLLVNRQLKV